MIKNFALSVPINSTSLGQVSVSILREIYSRGIEVPIFPIANVDLSTQKEDVNFSAWIQNCIKLSYERHSRKNPALKLWHINGSMESISKEQVLLSFYEVDTPTEVELNVVKNNSKVVFTSKYATDKFIELGCDNVNFIPLGFDNFNFYRTEPKKSSSIQFGLFGKLEPQRKRHLKTLSLWAKKYGNNPKYTLNCAIFNNFLDPQLQSQIINQALEGKQYWNINFLPFLPQNASFNELLNNIDIVLAMSGGEGWGLPEFQAVALGKHCVGLNAHSYKEWMDEENSVLIPPNGKIPVYDNIFFKQGLPFNQGSIFDWSEISFLNALEEVEKRFEINPVNENGLKLQNKFTYANTVDKIIELINTL